MKVSIIAAVSANRVIGRDNKLPWRLSTDLKRFKQLTSGHHVIMGRKTFDEIGRKPLPGRTNIIVTRQKLDASDVVIASSIDAAFDAVATSEDEVFVLGGAEIFGQTMHRTGRMYITQVHADVEGDTFFPEFDDVNEWRLTDREDIEADEKNEYDFSFLVYDRAKAPGIRAEEALLPE